MFDMDDVGSGGNIASRNIVSAYGLNLPMGMPASVRLREITSKCFIKIIFIYLHKRIKPITNVKTIAGCHIAVICYPCCTG
jgi:hypothetical protein